MAFEALAPRLERFRKLALWIGVAALAVTVFLGLVGWGNFFQSYLYAFLFWLGISLGSLLLLMVANLAGGPWATLIRRPAEAGAMVTPILALLFIIILIGMGSLYPWVSKEYLASHPLVANKTLWLNPGFFILRAIIYFGAWTLLAWAFYRWGQQQDADASQASAIAVKSQKLAAGGIVLFIMTMTFAAFDWGMSLRPDWFSGLYGAIFMIGQAISAVAFIILFLYIFANIEPLKSKLNKKYVQDLGNFMMAFTMFWAYVNVSQLIIIWSGNLVETNTWFVVRMDAEGPWRAVGGFIMLFHFFVPFIILFSRWVKQSHRQLTIVACWMLFVRLVDLFFYIIPEFGRESAIPLHLSDILALVGIGGVWMYFFFQRIIGRGLLPTNDPRGKLGDYMEGGHH